MGNSQAGHSEGIEREENETVIGNEESPNLEDPVREEEQDRRIVFNVGGQIFSTAPSTLAREPRSILARMMEMEENRDRIRMGQEIFIDRDGSAFGHALNYLRNGDRFMLPVDDAIRNALLQEAEFFQLDGLVHMIKSAQNLKMAVSTLQTKPIASAKIVILGASGVGKTSLLQQYFGNTFITNQPTTVGVDYRTKLRSIEGKAIKFYFWDTSGQERFGSITHSYYRGSKGALFVYDVSSPESFMAMRKWIDDFRTCSGDEGDGKMPQVFLANKSDLETTRVISTEQGEEFAKNNGLMYAEASAKQNIGVEHAFELIIEKVLQNAELWDKHDGKSGKRVKKGDGHGKKFFGFCC